MLNGEGCVWIGLGRRRGSRLLRGGGLVQGEGLLRVGEGSGREFSRELPQRGQGLVGEVLPLLKKHQGTQDAPAPLLEQGGSFLLQEHRVRARRPPVV
jgi:hypothetical protein